MSKTHSPLSPVDTSDYGMIELNQTPLKAAKDTTIPDIFFNRLRTGNEAIDELFGNGILPGSATIIHGSGGSGKTTFLLQLGELLTNQDYEVGYCGGEEANEQTAFTCHRVGVRNLRIAAMNYIEDVMKAMVDMDLLIIDSLASLTSYNAELAEKTDTRRGEIMTKMLTEHGQKNQTAIIIVLHVNKNGEYKGSTKVKHTVDAHLSVTIPDPEEPTLRRVSMEKNRFGPPSAIIVPMLVHGYQFNEAARSTVAVETNSKVGKAQSKSKRKNAEVDQILQMATAEEGCTMESIAVEVKLTYLRADFLVRQLVNDRKVVKEGRGPSAIVKIREESEE